MFFIKCLSDRNDVYKSTEECNPEKKQKVLIVFDYMIADLISNKKLDLVVTDLFIRVNKLNISHIQHTIVFSSTKECKTICYTLFDYEDSKQTKTSTNRY